jgi:hypothetical protein
MVVPVDGYVRRNAPQPGITRRGRLAMINTVSGAIQRASAAKKPTPGIDRTLPKSIVRTKILAPG